MLAQSLHWRGVSKRNDSFLETSEAALDTFFKDNGVLETSEAALDAFLKMAVSLEQAKQISTHFQR